MSERRVTATATSSSVTYVYTANEGSDSVSGYSLAADGALLPLAGSPFAAGPGAIHLRGRIPSDRNGEDIKVIFQKARVAASRKKS